LNRDELTSWFEGHVPKFDAGGTSQVLHGPKLVAGGTSELLHRPMRAALGRPQKKSREESAVAFPPALRLAWCAP